MKFLSKFLKKDMLIWPILIIAGFVLGLILLSWLNPFRFITPEKNQTWILPQGLVKTLSKQQMLKEAISPAGSVSLLDIVKIATSSGVPKQQVVKKGRDVYLSTGPSGEVKTDLVYGRYKVSVIPIPGVDFMGIPTEIDINKPIFEIKLGLTEGTGKIKGVQNVSGGKPQSTDLAKIVIYLFHDQNKDGIRELGEPKVLWAGVTIKLTKK